MKTNLKLRSGVVIPCIDESTAAAKRYLSRNELNMLHLMPSGDPVAFSNNEDGSIKCYFDSDHIVEAPPELWYTEDNKKVETFVLSSGTSVPRMNTRKAASRGFYTREKLTQMNYEAVEEPVAYTMRDGEQVFFYDKHTASRLPLMCVKCGKDVRFQRKLCRACFEEDMIVRRAQGDEHRNAEYFMDPKRVLFFDLELTGFYDHDEIISISILNGCNELVMNTFVKPVHTKK